MLLQALLFAAGLVALYYGAEWLVRGAARIAGALGVSPLVIGLTVVAFGTSTPELVVSLLAAARGQADVAMGNIVGSNILNIALILGLAALVSPLRTEMRLVVREMPVMVATGLLLWLMGLDGVVGRRDALLLLAAFAAYVAFVLRTAPREAPAIQEEYAQFEKAEKLEPVSRRRGGDVLLIILGLAALALGARLLVDASLFFARALGVPELFISVTIVALGTSLPELATSVLAAWRREADIAIGNIVGSNIFNILGILGVAGLVYPVGVNPGMLRLEIPVMLLTSVVLAPILYTRLRIERWEGVALLGGYAAFVAVLIVRAP